MNIEKAVPKYLAILRGERRPRFRSETHLDYKIEQALGMLKGCNLCERKCGADRTESELGFCRVSGQMSVSGSYIGCNDLSLLCPSYDIFFLGCTLRCVFCQNWETSQAREPRKQISEKGLAKIVDSWSRFKIIDFVGGDPTPQLPFVLRVLSYLKKDAPVMWNSGFYMSTEAMELLRGVIDIYSPSFKYGNNRCAKRLSNVENYTEVIKRNLVVAFNDSEIILRHLVMPGHAECCSKPILRFVANNFGNKVLVHLMGQYTPEWKARNYREISRAIKKKEFEEVISYTEELGLNYIVEE
ncbi:radical SAM protein [Patescibacteria group bacterium]|nr:radical SAM protein [Patescibacteria group bacterium]